MDDVIQMIRAVEWGSYSHAYGPAIEMEDWLLGWLRGVPEEEMSGEGITVSVFHQGDVHTAAEPLAPIALAVLESERTDLHLDAMYWLATTLGGSQCSWMADGFDPAVSMYPPAHAAAARGLPRFLELLESSPSEDLRLAARSVLPWIPGRANEIADWIGRNLDRAPDREELILILATVDWHRHSRAHEPVFRSMLETADTRVAGAVALARIRVADDLVGATLAAALQRRLPGVRCQGLWCDEQPLVEVVADAFLLTAFPAGSTAATGHLTSEQMAAIQALVDAFPDPEPAPGATSHEHMLTKARAAAFFPSAVPGRFGLPARRDELLDAIDRQRILAPPDRSGPDPQGRFHAPSPSARRWNVTAAWAGAAALAIPDPFTGSVSLLSLRDGTELARLLPGPVPESLRPSDAWHWPATPQWLRAHPAPDGRLIAADAAGLVGVWEVASDAVCRYLGGFAPTRVELAWSHDAVHLAAARRDGLAVYATEDWTFRLVEAPSRVGRVAWTESLFAAAGSRIGPIYAWAPDLSGHPEVAIESGGRQAAPAVAPKVAAVAAPAARPGPGIDISQRLGPGRWQVTTLATPGHASAVAWSPTGSYLAATVAGPQGSQLAFWETVDEIPTGDPVLLTLGRVVFGDRVLAWAPEGDLIAVDLSHTVDIFSPHATQPVVRLRPSKDGLVWETSRVAAGDGPDWVSRRSAAHLLWQSHPDRRPTLVDDATAQDAYWDAVVRPELVFAPFAAGATDPQQD